jgi:hypothetical protein
MWKRPFIDQTVQKNLPLIPFVAELDGRLFSRLIVIVVSAARGKRLEALGERITHCLKHLSLSAAVVAVDAVAIELV